MCVQKKKKSIYSIFFCAKANARRFNRCYLKRKIYPCISFISIYTVNTARGLLQSIDTLDIFLSIHSQTIFYLKISQFDRNVFRIEKKSS